MARRVIVLADVAIGLAVLVMACSSADDSPADESPSVAASAPESKTSVEIYTLQQDVPMTLNVTTTSLKATGYLQKEFTCEGSNASPHVIWSEAPDGTRSFAVVVDDVDAEEGAFAHWLLGGLPADATELAAGASGSSGLPVGSVEGVNGYDASGWRGPCPPPRVIGESTLTGDGTAAVGTGLVSSRYVVSVYALDTQLSLDSTAAMADVLRAIDGRILAGGSFETKYLSSITIRK